MHRSLLFVSMALTLVACDPAGDVDGGIDAGGDDIDGGALDAGPSGSDAGPRDAGPSSGDAGPGTDAGPDSSTPDGGPPPTDGGAGACGAEPTPSGRRLPPSCEQARCFGDDTCASLVVTAWGFAGYTACGRRYMFDAADSATACMNEPFSGFLYPASCGRIEFSGRVRLFCAPDRTEVVAYFWGTASESLSPFLSFDYASHEYASGARAGSGNFSSGVAAADFRMLSFHGIQDASVRATPTGFEGQMLSVWFHTQDVITPSSFSTAGGFEILLSSTP